MMEFNSLTSYFVILFEIYLDPTGVLLFRLQRRETLTRNTGGSVPAFSFRKFVFPYIICGFYIILLLLRTYTASPTALSDASTNTCISEHSSGVHQDTFMRSYWLNAFSSSSSVPFLQLKAVNETSLVSFRHMMLESTKREELVSASAARVTPCGVGMTLSWR
ncbi:Peroxisomal LYS1 stabilizing protein [Dirofilaria immitis]